MSRGAFDIEGYTIWSFGLEIKLRCSCMVEVASEELGLSAII